MKPRGAANYAVSRAGTLLYMIGAVDQTTPRSLVWVDRKGHEESIGAPLRAYGTPRLSPDGTRVAAEIYDQNTDIWIWDFARKTLRRLTFDPAGEGMSVWTPDGRGIIYESGPVPNLYRRAADGTGTVERLVTSATAQWPTAITPDGAHLVGFERSGVIFVPLTPLRPSVDTRFEGAFADVSPNGRYLTYQSSESGRDEIYVRPFPARRQRPLAGLDGGRDTPCVGPEWSRAVLPRCIECAHERPGQRSRADVQRGQAGNSVRDEVCRVQSVTPLRRVGGRPSIPDDQGRPGESERHARQPGRRRALVRRAETAPACDNLAVIVGDVTPRTKRGNGGVDGTRTRGLRRDRPAF